MSKRTSAMSDIKKGKNLERSLSAFAKDLSAVYGSSAILNLSMNYANYFVNSKEKETDRSFTGIGDKINALIKSAIVEGNVSKESIEEIENIREEVKARVDAATAFLSAFEMACDVPIAVNVAPDTASYSTLSYPKSSTTNALINNINLLFILCSSAACNF